MTSDYLGAVEVAPGRYAFRFDGERYCIAPFDAAGPDMEQSVEMPAWWSPERRFAWRLKKRPAKYADKTPGYHPAYLDKRYAEKPRFPGVERITASLETGEEVPA